jgi:hypothetical protein
MSKLNILYGALSLNIKTVNDELINKIPIHPTDHHKPLPLTLIQPPNTQTAPGPLPTQNNLTRRRINLDLRLLGQKQREQSYGIAEGRIGYLLVQVENEGTLLGAGGL